MQKWEHEKCDYEGCQMRFNPDEAGTPDGDGFFTGWYLPDFLNAAQREASDNLPLHDHTIDGVMH